MQRVTTASAIVRISSTEYSRSMWLTIDAESAESGQPVLHLVVRTDERQKPRRAAVERNRWKRLPDERMIDALARGEPADRIAEPRRHRDAVPGVAARGVRAVEAPGVRQLVSREGDVAAPRVF